MPVPFLFSLLYIKGMKKDLIKVTRQEVGVLREMAPNAHIAIVNRGHKNKTYYVEESREARRIIGELRGTWQPKEERPRHNKNNQRH